MIAKTFQTKPANVEKANQDLESQLNSFFNKKDITVVAMSQSSNQMDGSLALWCVITATIIYKEN